MLCRPPSLMALWLTICRIGTLCSIYKDWINIVGSIYQRPFHPLQACSGELSWALFPPPPKEFSQLCWVVSRTSSNRDFPYQMPCNSLTGSSSPYTRSSSLIRSILFIFERGSQKTDGSHACAREKRLIINPKLRLK